MEHLRLECLESFNVYFLKSVKYIILSVSRLFQPHLPLTRCRGPFLSPYSTARHDHHILQHVHTALWGSASTRPTILASHYFVPQTTVYSAAVLLEKKKKKQHTIIRFCVWTCSLASKFLGASTLTLQPPGPHPPGPSPGAIPSRLLAPQLLLSSLWFAAGGLTSGLCGEALVSLAVLPLLRSWPLQAWLPPCGSLPAASSSGQFSLHNIPLLCRHIGSFHFSSAQFSRSVVSDSLRPQGLQHARPPCPSPTPRVYSNSLFSFNR